MPKSTIQRFDDGLLRVYRLENIAPPGEYPEDGLTLLYTLPYRERTVGVQRHWLAAEAKVKISHLLRCPRPPDTPTHKRAISTADVVQLRDGLQYAIRQIQYPEDILPPVMDLTLELSAQQWEVRDDA